MIYSTWPNSSQQMIILTADASWNTLFRSQKTHVVVHSRTSGMANALRSDFHTLMLLDTACCPPPQTVLPSGVSNPTIP